MLNIEDKVKEYIRNNTGKCYALADWKKLKNKDFPIKEILSCICKAADGSTQEMTNIIDKLTAKKKTQGRTHVYNTIDDVLIDIIRNENGELELKGYESYNPLPLHGQHVDKNPKIYRKKDDQVNKIYKKAEEKMYNLGKEVRELYTDADNHTLTMIMQAIRKFAEQKKINTSKVVNRLKRGSYDIDFDTWTVVPIIKEDKEKKKTIVINENDINKIIITPHKYNVHIKRFISQLLQDPVNAQPSDLFKINGFNRTKLLDSLLKRKIISRKQRLSDTDENGKPKTATMMVKYICPKKDFERKLDKLYMALFEKNLPPRKKKGTLINDILNEDGATGCCNGIDGMGGQGAGGGAFISPIGNVMRRGKSIYRRRNKKKKNH